jgi:hypothetical protein
MPSKPKRGRKPRTLGAAEKQLMGDFSKQLYGLLSQSGWTVERIARELRVSRASVYNYRNETDLAGHNVLRRAHFVLGFQFRYMDFDGTPVSKSRRKNRSDAQGVLPFLKALRQDDIQIVGKKSVDRDTLELTVHIRFAS